MCCKKEDPGENDDLADDPRHSDTLRRFEELLRTIVDPEAVSLQAKRDLGLIGNDGEDYTLTLHVHELEEHIRRGDFSE